MKKTSLFFFWSIIVCVSLQAQSASQTEEISMTEIRKVSPLISTGLAVRCEDFILQFADNISIDTIVDQKHSQKILAIIDEAEQNNSEEFYVDTRAILTVFYQNGNSQQICIGLNLVSLD